MSNSNVTCQGETVFPVAHSVNNPGVTTCVSLDLIESDYEAMSNE